MKHGRTNSALRRENMKCVLYLSDAKRIGAPAL
jgi:hypothetical protein